MWKEPHLMEQPKPNAALTPKTIGRSVIWCKNCFSEGKKEEDCRMMKKNLKIYSASKKNAEEAFFTSWPCREPKNNRDSARVRFPASIFSPWVKKESPHTSSNMIHPESIGAPIKRLIFDLAPQSVSPFCQFESSAVSVKVEVEPKQSELMIPTLSEFTASQQFSCITEKKQNKKL